MSITPHQRFHSKATPTANGGGTVQATLQMKRFGSCCLRASRDRRRSATGEFVAMKNRLLSSSARACTGNTPSSDTLGSSPPQPSTSRAYTSHLSPPIMRARARNFATASPTPTSVSLRRLSAPFLLLCHPDKISASSSDLRDTNLRATQTLNGLIDTVEALYDRCVSGQTGAARAAGRIELQPRYEVEFLVPCSSDNITGGKKKKKRGGGTDGQTSYTRRSIIITYPASLRDDVQIVDRSGQYSLAAASALRRRTATEIVRLLKVAGASVPEDVLGGLLDDGSGDIGNEADGSTPYGHEDYLVDELDLRGMGVDMFLKRGRFSSDGSGAAAKAATRPRTLYEKSRQEFVKSVDWAALRRRSEEALRDAEADVVTSRIMKRDEHRKEQMVSNILARVTVDPNPACVTIDNANGDATQTESIKDKRTDEEKGLDPLQQLIALRRLSLLLTDNYNELQLNDMGKLWDNTHIVLTPSRDSGDDSPTRDEGGNTIVQSSAAYGIPRRRNPLISGKESGFKFTYGSDGGITVYVPVDFTDEELTLQLTSNVWDVYNLCGDGVEDLYPEWFKNYG